MFILGRKGLADLYLQCSQICIKQSPYIKHSLSKEFLGFAETVVGSLLCFGVILSAVFLIFWYYVINFGDYTRQQAQEVNFS